MAPSLPSERMIRACGAHYYFGRDLPLARNRRFMTTRLSRASDRQDIYLWLLLFRT